MSAWGKDTAIGLGMFIVGLLVAGSGNRPRSVQDIGTVIALAGIAWIVRAAWQAVKRRRARRGSDPTP